jgi:osmoprotectant transport system permease protein
VDERLAAALRLLPEYLSQHVLLSAAALALGVGVSLPLIVGVSRRPRLRWPVLGFASLVQTVPGIALLALFYPLLLALSALSERLFGRGFSALGFLPSLLALTLYSILPILRNGVTALTNLDPAVLQAARAVGMTRKQRLLRIELPLAAPVIMAGIRTSAVWVIGTATLSTPIGQTSLGNYIFSGLQVENWVAVLFGCTVAVVLALVTDELLAAVESGVSKRKPARAWVGVGLLLAGVAAAGVAALQGSGERAYVIGAKNFSEQYILADLLAQRVGQQGGATRVRIDLGSTVAFRALAHGDIDAYVDYSGTVWANILERRDRPSREEMLEELRHDLRSRYGVLLVGALGFENAYALAMRRDRAAALGVHSIADLAAQASQLRMGGDLEFFARPEWQDLRAAYGISRFKEQRQFQPTFMYQALVGGEVDVISAFSSDGRIAANDLVVLEDPKHAIPPYDAILLLSPSRASDPLLERAFEPLKGKIPIELMRQANYMVDRSRDKLTPTRAADWLASAAHLR